MRCFLRLTRAAGAFVCLTAVPVFGAELTGTVQVAGRPAKHAVVWLEASGAPAVPVPKVVLDQRNGAELLRLTNDEQSFNPVWSPMMDAIAFFKVQHGVVDLWVMPLEGTAPDWTLGEAFAMTTSAGLDAASRPAWFIPADQLPALPTPAPASSDPGATVAP